MCALHCTEPTRAFVCICVCVYANVCVCILPTPTPPPPVLIWLPPHMQVCWSMIDLGRGSGHILNWSWFPLLPPFRPGVYHRLSVMFVCFHRSALLREAVGGGGDRVWGKEEERKKEKKESLKSESAFPSLSSLLPGINLQADGADATTQGKC